ncbi:hypothetical protein GO730_39240 [Spirosoma sp. HMF3257]|uniref:Uncharacterized protein n=1 Tax=Spirosoma telluris TaxID=2183553 RepID=A0A327NCJ6_9BACT|nr:hypothetical protein [Spirosoma telluris]RAI72927.1 hypothetical protein HMF3257_39180 [Spirosoma telluris]
MFKNDDIQLSLLMDNDTIMGANTQINSYIYPTLTDSNGIHDYIISSHEFTHHVLNYTSIYGIIMKFYAYLISFKLKNEVVYRSKLNILVSKCKVVHEICATWNSIEKSNYDYGVEGLESLLKDNKDYLAYYNQGNLLVEGLPSIFLKSITLIVMSIISLQSKSIYLLASGGLYKFKPSQINENDLPYKRLLFLKSNLSSEFLLSIIKKFLIDTYDFDTQHNDLVSFTQSKKMIKNFQELYLAIFMKSSI